MLRLAACPAMLEPRRLEQLQRVLCQAVAVQGVFLEWFVAQVHER